MRLSGLLVLAAAAFAAILGTTPPASADGAWRNRDGCGIYTPDEPPVRHRPRAYRYDPHSWCYQQRGYYPYYNSGQWVPKAQMRYRYRYVYSGPRFRYGPGWGYGW